jgi:RNA polymerase sigma factor (sigma-70 family)
MSALTNDEYIRGIATNDHSVLQNIYQVSLPEIAKYIYRNTGTEDDAKDVFQEGILVLYRKIKAENLTLTTSFHVFLFSVCKRIWLRKLKKRGKKEVPFEDNDAFIYEEELEESFIKRRKWSLFNKKLEQMSEECRNVLRMFFDGRSGKEIAQQMGYSEDYAKRKKYKCKLSLTDLIKKDPEYKYLIQK